MSRESLHSRIARGPLVAAVVSLLAVLQWASAAAATMGDVRRQIAAHAGQSGVYVLEKGEEALLARAWLADHAEHTVDVQYFIWSTDNIGILAAESILRAAERGVRVRVIVDDLMTDAPGANLLAMARHPNIDIRIYNPKLRVGVPFYKRWFNVASDFHGVNQRMHDKTFIVDGKIAITGGRNMAAEYYDYHHEYNFRDRDALVAGAVVGAMQTSFERFWNSELSAPVEDLLAEKTIDEQAHAAERAAIYAELHRYAADASNFAPEVRAALNAEPAFDRLAAGVVWCPIDFLSDQPGKTASSQPAVIAGSLGDLLANAKEHIVIQSPYLVLSKQAKTLLAAAIERKVKVRISTNSLASTDNLQAFSGYRKQRAELLKMGVEIFEYRPDAQAHRALRMTEVVGKVMIGDARDPLFGLHAKTVVIDRRQAFIGAFNLDPRSQNLNTEVGVLIYDAGIAQAVSDAIETDMRPENSWNASHDQPDRFAPLAKRSKVRFWQLLPLEPLL